MLRILIAAFVAASAAAGEVKYDSIYDKFPLPDARYTADGERFTITNPQGNLHGLQPPFVVRAVPITVDESPEEPLYLINMSLDMRQVDGNGLPRTTGGEYAVTFVIFQEEGADLASCRYILNGAESAVTGLIVSIHDIAACSVSVDANGVHTCSIEVEGLEDPIDILTVPAQMSEPALHFWQVAPFQTMWLDLVTVSGPNVVDRNGGEDVHKFRDSNGDGDTNAVDIQFIINAVLGIGK